MVIVIGLLLFPYAFARSAAINNLKLPSDNIFNNVDEANKKEVIGYPVKLNFMLPQMVKCGAWCSPSIGDCSNGCFCYNNRDPDIGECARWSE